MAANPFVYGRVVSKAEFCLRPALEKGLRDKIESKQNVVVQGPRRSGKTSLICETIRKMKKTRLVYVDLMEIKSADDFCRRVVKAVMSAAQHAGFLETAMKSLAYLRPVFSFDPLSGLPTVSLGMQVALEPDSIEAILDLVSRSAQGKRTVVVFDEFQDILGVAQARSLLAVLRSKIQFQRNLPYVFSGSIRNRMTEIFSDPESPFFKSAAVLEVGPIDRHTFASFIRRKFAKGNRTVTGRLPSRVLDIVQDNPGDAQQLCAALWDCSADSPTVDESFIPKAFELIFSREAKGYEAHLHDLSPQQLKCLAGLARLGGKAPLSSEFISQVGIAQPASVRKALERLVDLRVIFRAGTEYQFSNPFFRSWILVKNI